MNIIIIIWPISILLANLTGMGIEFEYELNEQVFNYNNSWIRSKVRITIWIKSLI